MLRLQPSCERDTVWDAPLPIGVAVLPADLARVDELLADRLSWRPSERSGGSAMPRRAAGRSGSAGRRSRWPVGVENPDSFTQRRRGTRG